VINRLTGPEAISVAIRRGTTALVGASFVLYARGQDRQCRAEGTQRRRGGLAQNILFNSISRSTSVMLVHVVIGLSRIT
jgi:hypothetical protein